MSLPLSAADDSPLSSRCRRDVNWFRGLLLLGVLLRLRAYLSNRSLWLDEAMLALNIRNRGFVELTRPLDMDQIAPVGFLWLEKAMVLLLGDTEWALRLVPLLCGIALLPLAYAAVRQCANSRLAAGVLAGLAVHPQLVYFSQEVKPYGIDAFAVVLVMLVAAFTAHELSSRQRWTAVGVVAVLPWFSLTSVFAIPGLLVTFFISAIRQRSSSAAVQAAVITGVFLLSCGLEYGLVLRHQMGNVLMQSYWAATFPSEAPGLAGLGAWVLATARSLLQDPGSIPGVLVLPLAVTLLFGLHELFRQARPLCWIIGSTIAIGILAAVLRSYPPQGRLWLFCVPPLVMTAAGGIEWLARWMPSSWAISNRVRTVVMVTGLAAYFSPAACSTLRWSVQPDRIRREDVRAMCEFILTHRHPGDGVYIARAAGPTVLWYLGRPEFQPLQEMPTTWGNPINGDIAHAETEITRCGTVPRLWLLFSHMDRLSTDLLSDAQRLRHALEPYATSVILHQGVPNDFESEPAWTELFIRKP